MATEEEFRALQVQVASQSEVIKKLTDGFTYHEGIVKETLEARLAGAMREIGFRAVETEEKFQKEINQNKENMERLIDKQRIDLNALNLNIVKELMEKVDEIEARVTGQQPGSVSASGGGASERAPRTRRGKYNNLRTSSED